MATVKLTAERLNFKMHRGDDFSHDFGFNWDLSGATVTARLIDENGQKVQDFTITAPVFVDLETAFTISLANTDLVGSYNWYMVIDDGKERTELFGDFTFIERGYEN